MAKYLFLKHYPGAPAAVNDVPMDKWTPAEIDLIALINAFNRGNAIVQQPAGDYRPGRFG